MRSPRLLCPLALCAAIVVGALAPSGAEADVQGFMKIPGLPGESTDAQHADEIDLISYNQLAGTATCFKAVALKGLDKASPGLALLAVKAQVLPSVTVTLTRVGAESLDIFTALLEHVTVGNVELVEVDGNPLPTERVTLRPRRATLSYRPQLPDGKLGSPIKTVVTCP